MATITSVPLTPNSKFKEYLHNGNPIAFSYKKPIENGRLRFFLMPYPDTPYTHILDTLVNHYRETDNFKIDIINAIKVSLAETPSIAS